MSGDARGPRGAVRRGGVSADARRSYEVVGSSLVANISCFSFAKSSQ